MQNLSAAADPLAPQYPIDSVDKALRLVLLMADKPEIRLSEAARFLGVATSTAHRLLAMLQYHGFVRQDPRTRVYRPGPAFASVAFSVFSRFDVQGVAGPVLRRLSEQLRETVHIALLDGAAVRFIAAVEGPQAVRVASRVGRSLPAHCTSSGKALLAQLGEFELHRLLPAERLATVMPRSIGSRTDLERELSAVRERGYATNCEESEEGVASVAVAVPTRAPGFQLALNLAAPTYRLPPAQYPAIAATLADAAGEISGQLG